MKTIQLKKRLGVVLLLIAITISTRAQSPVSAENDPSIQKDIRMFLKGLNNSGGQPIETLTPLEAREVLVGAQNSVEFDYADIEESEITITQEGQSIKLHIVKPKGAKEGLPVFMFFHGGGWVLGDFPTHKRLVRDLVVTSGAVAVFPDYSPSPEAKFPIAINQAYAATKWVSEHGREIGVDGSRLAVAGNSVGGNMATVVSLMAKDFKGPKIKYQVLLWPVTDSNFTYPSYVDFANERFLTTSLMKWMWDNYIPDHELRKNKYASPLQASVSELQGLPPALIQVAENDILHDEAVAYGRKLDEAGVSTIITEYRGFIHDYGMLNPLANIPAVQGSVNQAALMLKEALFTN